MNHWFINYYWAEDTKMNMDNNPMTIKIYSIFITGKNTRFIYKFIFQQGRCNPSTIKNE